MLTPVSIARSGFIASGQVGWPHHASGAVRSGHAADSSVTSGNVASGHVGQMHVASGAVTSGRLGTTGTPDGTKFLRDDFAWTAVSVSLASGDVGSGKVASGAVQGFFGTTRHIASGTVGVFDFGSGAVIAGAVGSGAVLSGNIASGQIGSFHLADESVTSGDIGSGQISTFKVASGGLLSGAIGSGQIGNTHLGSGAVLSGHVASGQIGDSHLASGQVQGLVTKFTIGSGTFNGFELGSGAIISGRIASGQVGTNHLASGSISQNKLTSGLTVNDLSVIVSGFNPLTSGMTEERISGVRAVCISPSGNIRIAMAAVSGRMPAIGIVYDNVASGIQVNVHQFGLFVPTSGLVEFSGYGGDLLYVSRSGQITTFSGSFNSGGFLSGDVIQAVGRPVQDFSGLGNPQVVMIGVAPGLTRQSFWITSGDIASGAVGRFQLASGSVHGLVDGFTIASGTLNGFEIGSGAIISGRIASGQLGDGHLASGQVQGLVTKFSIGSGTFNGFELGSGAIVSGRVASGQIGDGHLASGQVQGLVTKFTIGSGTFNGFELGSGAIVSGRIASGQVGDRHIASGQIQGLVTRFTIGSGTFNGFELGSGAIVSGHIASGQIGNFAISSGSVTSGRLGVTGTPDGTQFLRDDFTWSAPTATVGSGGIGSGKVASGTVQGFFGTTRHIASGTVGVFDFGSGAVVAGAVGSGAIVSGNVASGQIGNFHISSGAVTSGRLGVTGTPDGTKVLRDDFTWVAPGAASVTSGAIDQTKIASGLAIEYAAPIVSGLTNNATFITEERISGVRAVMLSQSGGLKIAKASLSGQMPAVGVAFDNAESGIQLNVYTLGLFRPAASGMIDGSGTYGQLLFVGRSGQVVTASGFLNSGGLLSGDVQQPLGVLANSGQVYLSVAAMLQFVPGLVVSGNIASGQVSQYHLASGCYSQGTFRTFRAAELLSGIQAVAIHVSGAGEEVVAAQRQSGLRMPAIGVVTGALSGTPVDVLVYGNLTTANSGTVASGFESQQLFVGSGGLLVNLSGFHAGASSGPGTGSFSGSYIQRVGYAISGGVFVNPSHAICLATVSGTYLRVLSGIYPVSGLLR